MAFTYRDLYLKTRRELVPLELDSEVLQLEAAELVCAAAGRTQEQLRMDYPLYVNDSVVEKAAELTALRLTGMPIAYVIGEWTFCGLDFHITPDVLIPRPETELLARLAVHYLRPAQGSCRVLDLCAGSGCIGITVAAYLKNVRSVLVDLSDRALELCKRNIRRHRLTGRVVDLKGDAMQPPSPALGHFDLLLCNPPYIPTGDIPLLDSSVKDFEPIMALDGGPDGLDFYRSVAVQWQTVIRPGGLILFEVGIGQAEDVAQILWDAGYERILITNDLSGIHRIVQGQKHFEPEFEFYDLLSSTESADKQGGPQDGGKEKGN